MRNKTIMSGPSRAFSGVRIERRAIKRFAYLEDRACFRTDPPWKPEDSVTLIAVGVRLREIESACQRAMKADEADDKPQTAAAPLGS